VSDQKKHELVKRRLNGTYDMLFFSPLRPFSNSASELVRPQILGTGTGRISSARVPHRCSLLDALSEWCCNGFKLVLVRVFLFGYMVRW
jgi:hypothetical protein